MRMRILFVCALALSLSVAAAAHSAELRGEPEEQLTGRDLFVKLMRTIEEGFPSDQLLAIRELGRQADKELLQEFGVVQVLNEIARDEKQFPRIRWEALDALVALYRRNVGSPHTLDMLIAVVEGEENKAFQTERMKALHLIAEMAREFEGVKAHKAFTALERIWKNRRRANLPTSMQTTVIATIGAFPDRDGTLDMLTEGLKSKVSDVRAGAFRGLQHYLNRGGSVNRRLTSEIFRLLKSKREDMRPEQRVEIIRVLGQLVARDPGLLANDKNARDLLLGLMRKEGGYGTDAEVQAAVRALAHVPDDEIVETFLSAAKPTKDKGWNFGTYDTLSKGLMKVFWTLRSNPKKHQETVEKIADHYIWLLKTKGTPEILVGSALQSLGMWTREFDRQKIVTGLVATLEALTEAGWVQMVEECEKSLQFLTAQEPFRKKDGSPDVEAWMIWYDANKKWLEPENHPLDK